MLIHYKEYAEKIGKKPSAVYAMILRKRFSTVEKREKQYYIDENEPYPERKKYERRSEETAEEKKPKKRRKKRGKRPPITAEQRSRIRVQAFRDAIKVLKKSRTCWEAIQTLEQVCVTEKKFANKPEDQAFPWDFEND